MSFNDPKELVCPVRPIGYHNLRLRARKSNSTWTDSEGNKHHVVYCMLCYEHYDSIIKISTDKKGKMSVTREFVPLTREEVTKLLKRNIVQIGKAEEKPIGL